MSKYANLTEKSIVRDLLKHLAKKGFTVESVYNTSEDVPVKNINEAMKAIFDTDISRVHFKEKGAGSVLLVGGNDENIISDWNFHEDNDPFDKAMEEFLETLD
jgi:hypothetical protein